MTWLLELGAALVPVPEFYQVNRHILSEIFDSVAFLKQLNIPKLMGKITCACGTRKHRT